MAHTPWSKRVPGFDPEYEDSTHHIYAEGPGLGYFPIFGKHKTDAEAKAAYLKDSGQKRLPRDIKIYKTAKAADLEAESSNTHHIYIPEEGHWPIKGAHKTDEQAKAAYLKWAGRKGLPRGAAILRKSGQDDCILGTTAGKPGGFRGRGIY